MQKWLFRLVALFLLLFSGYFTIGKTSFAGKHQISHQKQASFKTATPNNAPQVANNGGIPAQIVNFQRHKTVHYVQHALYRFNESATYIRYLYIACGRYSGELSYYRKLILFPFHVFW